MNECKNEQELEIFKKVVNLISEEETCLRKNLDLS